MKPSEEYTIHILEDEDFDLLPVGHPRQAFGMADPKRKRAWVRRTHVKHLDMANIAHEFDELMASTSTHEIDGIRYKSGGGLGRILGPILGTIVGVVTGNPMAGAAVGAALSGGTQAHTQSVKPEKYGSGAGGILQSAAIGGAGGYGGSSLINAGRVAATNAAIASEAAGGAAGNTMATLGAGLKGAGTAALSTGAGNAAFKGAQGAFTSPQVAESVSSSVPPPLQTSFIPKQATTAFSPVGSEVQKPLSEFDFKQGLSDIEKNRMSQRESVFSQFRGLGSPTSNTAFSRALGDVDKSYRTTRSQFEEDQQERLRLAGLA